MPPATWLNIGLTLVALAVAFVYLRRDHLREKAKEDWLKSFAQYSKTREFKQRNSYAAQYREIADPGEMFPALERDGFEFSDLAREACLELPELPLPPLRIKRAIQPGDQVLLRAVRDTDTADNDIWVQVEAVLKNDLFAGTLIATPSNDGTDIIGRKVVFSANHIALIERPGLRSKPN